MRRGPHVSLPFDPIRSHPIPSDPIRSHPTPTEPIRRPPSHPGDPGHASFQFSRGSEAAGGGAPPPYRHRCAVAPHRHLTSISPQSRPNLAQSRPSFFASAPHVNQLGSRSLGSRSLRAHWDPALWDPALCALTGIRLIGIPLSEYLMGSRALGSRFLRADWDPALCRSHEPADPDVREAEQGRAARGRSLPLSARRIPARGGSRRWLLTAHAAAAGASAWP